MKIMPVFAATALATAMTASPAYSATVELEAQGPVIELSVFESITAEPDLVTIGAGVTSEAPTAVEAMRQNARNMRQVVDRIKALGIDEDDIQTTGINLNARYDYSRDNQPSFRGYQVSNRVSVKLRDIDETGAVLDALVVAGATDLSGPTFSLEDDANAKDTARRRAVERAQERAQSYAAMVGYAGVRVLKIEEAFTGQGPTPQMARAMADSAIVLTGSAVVQPGRVETGVNVTITFEMTGATEG